MRIILDTNVIVSGLMSESGPPAELLNLWEQGAFTLLVSAAQIAELTNVLARPQIARRIPAELAARFLAALQGRAELCESTFSVEQSSDPKDNFLLSMAVAGQASLLISGDKRHLLTLVKIGSTLIVSPVEGLALVEKDLGNSGAIASDSNSD